MSFLKDIREELCALPVKKKCCRKAVFYGMLLSKACMETGNTISLSADQSYVAYTLALIREFCGEEAAVSVQGRRVLLSFGGRTAAQYVSECETAQTPGAGGCNECLSHFYRGIFLGCGRAENPESTYRMEFVSSRPDALKRWLEQILYEKLITTVRRGETLLLVRDSGSIEDFLMFIGAKDSAFRLMNSKIEHQLKGDANRVANCEANNIGKTVQKAMEQTELILRLKEEGLLSSLPQELEAAARLRMEYPDLSISQLCLKFSFPISKSGMNHRLNKLVKAATALLDKKEV